MSPTGVRHRRPPVASAAPPAPSAWFRLGRGAILVLLLTVLGLAIAAVVVGVGVLVWTQVP